jgi:ABC-type multidrug transport system ATPase subunit
MTHYLLVSSLILECLSPLTLPSVDAHVGKSLFQDAILGSLRGRGKSVILVTHALHFLSQCDYIYTLDNGRIAEHGTYEQLSSSDGEFARLNKQFGGHDEKKDDADHAEESAKLTQTNEVDEAKLKERKGAGIGRLEGRLIVKEKRTTGSVSWRSQSVQFHSYLLVEHIVLQSTGRILSRGEVT